MVESFIDRHFYKGYKRKTYKSLIYRVFSGQKKFNTWVEMLIILRREGKEDKIKN